MPANRTTQINCLGRCHTANSEHTQNTAPIITCMLPDLFSHAFACMLFALAGGEGATAREVLRHQSVKKVVMVDIDKVG
jgi:spermidine synthase